MRDQTKLDEKIIKQALAEIRKEEETIKKIIEEGPPDMAKIGRQTTSAFDREIKRLAHAHENKYYTIFKHDVPKAAVYLIGAIILTVTMAACIWMGKKFIAKYNTENVDLSLEETMDSPVDFVYYFPTYLPDGFEMDEQERHSTYSETRYIKENEILRIEQFSSNTTLSEDIKGEFYERDNGDEYYYTERYGDSTLIFELDGFIFKIEGVNIFEDELLKIYYSMERE